MHFYPILIQGRIQYSKFRGVGGGGEYRLSPNYAPDFPEFSFVSTIQVMKMPKMFAPGFPLLFFIILFFWGDGGEFLGSFIFSNIPLLRVTQNSTKQEFNQNILHSVLILRKILSQTYIEIIIFIVETIDRLYVYVSIPIQMHKFRFRMWFQNQFVKETLTFISF